MRVGRQSWPARSPGKAESLLGQKFLEARAKKDALLRAIEQKRARGLARFQARLDILLDMTPLTELLATHLLSFLVRAEHALPPVTRVEGSLFCVPCNLRFSEWADVLDHVANSLEHLPPQD